MSASSTAKAAVDALVKDGTIPPELRRAAETHKTAQEAENHRQRLGALNRAFGPRYAIDWSASPKLPTPSEAKAALVSAMTGMTREELDELGGFSDPDGTPAAS